MLGEKSQESVPVTSGVYLASVLDLILLLIYINDLPDTVTSKARLIANDTTLYLTIEVKEGSAVLQQDHDN